MALLSTLAASSCSGNYQTAYRPSDVKYDRFEIESSFLMTGSVVEFRTSGNLPKVNTRKPLPFLFRLKKRKSELSQMVFSVSMKII